jgi:hypothetical protein
MNAALNVHPDAGWVVNQLAADPQAQWFIPRARLPGRRA